MTGSATPERLPLHAGRCGRHTLRPAADGDTTPRTAVAKEGSDDRTTSDDSCRGGRPGRGGTERRGPGGRDVPVDRRGGWVSPPALLLPAAVVPVLPASALWVRRIRRPRAGIHSSTDPLR